MRSPPPVAPPPPVGAPAPRPKPRWHRFVLPVGAAVAFALFVGVLWVVGGLKETPQQPVKAPGNEIDQGRFSVTVRDAKIVMQKGALDIKIQRYVIVRMHVVSHDKESASLSSGGLLNGVAARTKTGKWVPPDDIEATAAGSKTLSIQPGLPVEAVAMWKMGPADAPKEFTVGLRQWEWGTGFTDKEYDWRTDPTDDALAGKLTLRLAAS
ncbi:hypothetical protein J4573_44960 [Actinomadura barringtoniae]|uniref:DUF4352 domain-containing protein n=1 Tax=Actinomadura barringtoniae TaxID=1427535 RepID=A0A939PLJ3_9ACTN|nr:hypothetical protein [Actinomadura barringtoniae]MBO2454303.1 hypothetical protein [Actinomadura barringtoniae]